MKITVVVDQAGQVIAAHVPVAAEQGPESDLDYAPSTAFTPARGQSVVEVELSEDDVPGVPQPDFLASIQQRMDGGSA